MTTPTAGTVTSSLNRPLVSILADGTLYVDPHLEGGAVRTSDEGAREVVWVVKTKTFAALLSVYSDRPAKTPSLTSVLPS